MNALTRTASIAIVVGLLTLCVFGLRLAYFPRNFQEIRRGEELQRLERVLLRRQEAKQQVVQEWIAQRCTLAETMERFQELEQQEWSEDYRTLLRESSGRSDEERYYRVIICYVHEVLQGRPEELATVLRRLEKDYQRFQAGRLTPSTAAPEKEEG